MTILARVVARLRPEAEKSAMGSRHAAAILYGGRIVSTGFNNVNRNNTNRKSTHSCVSCHAEVDALRKDRYDDSEEE